MIDESPLVGSEAIAIHEVNGPPNAERILWVHGYTLDSSIWAPLWARLPEYHHIAVDLPGHGASRPLRADDDLSRVARALGAIAAERGAQHVAGLSFGGMVALQIAIEMPHAVKSLMLGSPALGGGPTDPHAHTRNMALMRLYQERGAGPWLRELWMQRPPDIFSGAARDPCLFQELATVIDRHRWSELGDLTMIRFMSYTQGFGALKAVRASTMVIIGDEDMPAFRRSAHLIKQHVPRCRSHHVADVGHLSLLEAPALVAPLIDAHVRASVS